MYCLRRGRIRKTVDNRFQAPGKWQRDFRPSFLAASLHQGESVTKSILINTTIFDNEHDSRIPTTLVSPIPLKSVNRGPAATNPSSLELSVLPYPGTSP